MDSGNSGSMQSSSTGGGGDNDQEYDSFSTFFNPFGAFDQNTQTLPFNSINKFNGGSSSSPSPSSFPFIFDPAPVHDHQQTPNSFGALDHNFIPIDNNNNHTNNWANKSQQIMTMRPQQPPKVAQLQDPRLEGPGRNPKKRARASRRAPTTVLTTDTSNFRQMVQEFTGIPAPPFSSAFSTTRLDLFGFGSGSGSSLRQFPQSPLSPMINPAGNFLSFQSLLQQSSSSSPMNNVGSGQVFSANNTSTNATLTRINNAGGNSLGNNNGGGIVRVEAGGTLDNSWICSSD